MFVQYSYLVLTLIIIGQHTFILQFHRNQHLKQIEAINVAKACSVLRFTTHFQSNLFLKNTHCKYILNVYLETKPSLEC